MSYLEWTLELDVGVDAMNGEHQRLIDLMNRFHELSEQGRGRSECTAALEALGKYTTEHFAHEEGLMERMGFPDLEKHKRIHRRLLEQLSEHVECYRKDGHSQELLMFLKVWLKAHIKGIDTKYGRYQNADRRSA